MAFEVTLSNRAIKDLSELGDYIADRAGFEIAEAYISRIEDSCRALCDFPMRGSPRDDLVPGLRTVSFERRATIAYMVQGRYVRIMRVLHHGRDAGEVFSQGTTSVKP